VPRIEGHRRGVRSVRRTTEEAARLGIGQLTLFCLSSENWKRPRLELDFLMSLLEQYVVEERQTLLRERIRLLMIGRRDGIPASTLHELDKTVDMTREHAGMRLCLAINYGSRGELADAARRVAADVQAGRLALADVDEASLTERLYTAGMPDPDLVIRTAGEMRLSNFLLWQASYAEFWVTERCWPDFDESTLHDALRDYASRQRRFGGLNA
jgi:undecaprenyl diphosphate synthase